MSPAARRDRSPFPRWCLRFLLALLLVIAGCGEEESTTQGPPPPPPPPPAPPAIAAPASNRPAAAPSRDQLAPRPTRRPPPTDELQRYSVDVAEPNFVAQFDGLPSDADAYLATRPGPGIDSRSFNAVSPLSEGSGVQVSVTLPPGFAVLSNAGVTEQGFPRRIRCERDGSEMAYVPGGAFRQGRDGADPAAAPAHAAYVDAFYIDVHEITLRQYEQFRVENLTTRKPQKALNAADPPEFPALGITWRDALNYSQWAGKELPTEAQWEKAARGENGFEFPWGNSRAIWAQPRAPGQIDEVGTHAGDRSIYGVFDLAGNAREWCADWFTPDSYAKSLRPDGGPVINPQGPTRSSPPNARVVKGSGAQGWFVWARAGVGMQASEADVGFRCVLKLPAEDQPQPGRPRGE